MLADGISLYSSTAKLWSDHHRFITDASSQRLRYFNRGLNRALDGKRLDMFGNGKGHFESIHRDDEEPYVKEVIGRAFDKAYQEGNEVVVEAAKAGKLA